MNVRFIVLGWEVLFKYLCFLVLVFKVGEGVARGIWAIFGGAGRFMDFVVRRGGIGV